MVVVATGDLPQAIDAWEGLIADGEAIGDDVLTAFGRGCVGYALLGMGQVEAAGLTMDTALTLTARAGHEFGLSLFRTIKGMQLFVSGDATGGAALVQSARVTQIRNGDFEGGGMALSFLASMAFSRGDLVRTMELYRESEAAFIIVGDKPELARVQGESGYAALAADDVADARRCFERALRTNDEVGSARGTGQALFGLAATEAAAGNLERAVTIAAAAQVMSAKAGVVIEHPMAPGVAERIEALRASVPKGELDLLVASGSALTPAAVLAMVAG
jgi:hypothetical protein